MIGDDFREQHDEFRLEQADDRADWEHDFDDLHGQTRAAPTPAEYASWVSEDRAAAERKAMQ